VEVKKVYDVNGNEPGKPLPKLSRRTGSASPKPVLQQQPGGGWGNGAQPQQNAQTASPAPAQAWSPGGQGVAANPPWGSR